MNLIRSNCSIVEKQLWRNRRGIIICERGQRPSKDFTIWGPFQRCFLQASGRIELSQLSGVCMTPSFSFYVEERSGPENWGFTWSYSLAESRPILIVPKRRSFFSIPKNIVKLSPSPNFLIYKWGVLHGILLCRISQRYMSVRTF